MPHEIEIVNLEHFPAPGPNGTITRHTFITYRIGGTKMSALFIDRELTEIPDIERAIEEEIKKKAPAIGHKFTIA